MRAKRATSQKAFSKGVFKGGSGLRKMRSISWWAGIGRRAERKKREKQYKLLQFYNVLIQYTVAYFFANDDDAASYGTTKKHIIVVVVVGDKSLLLIFQRLFLEETTQSCTSR